MNNKTLVMRLKELRTLNIINSLEEEMILNVLLTHRQVYAPVVKEMNDYLTLVQKKLLSEDEGKIVMNAQLHKMLGMKLETPSQNMEYNEITLILRQLVNRK